MSEPLKSIAEIVDKLRDIFIGDYSWPAAKVIITKELYEREQSIREDQRKISGNVYWRALQVDEIICRACQEYDKALRTKILEKIHQKHVIGLFAGNQVLFLEKIINEAKIEEEP